jgi:uncharacterized RDD family membrane protein YckC
MSEMNDPNPYRSPAAQVADPAAASDLASLGERLAAALLDGFAMLLINLPLMYFGGYFRAVMDAAMTGKQPPFTLLLTWSAVAFAILLLVQGYPLHAWGQTWGKRILRIRIADLDGGKPSLATLIGRRYLPIQVVALVPLLGNLLVLVDILMVFRGDRRCAHDLIAGTRVVKAG